MPFQGDGCDFPLSFHFVNDKGNYREIKPSGRRVEVKGQFNSIFEFNMELELIQVDCDGVRFGISRHFSTPQILLKRQEILSGSEAFKKCHGTYRDGRYHMLKLASIQK